MSRLAPTLAILALASGAVAQERIDFDKHVRPILARHCLSCHGPDKQRGGLRLDRRADALRGGDGGAVIVPKRAADSPLARLVAGADADRVMPPDGPRLPATDVAMLKAWIDQGAEWPDDGSTNATTWWSFRPLAMPAVPQIRDLKFEIRNPVDAFLAATFAAKRLTPTPEADRRTLARRLYFDLVGLPPSPEQIDAFVADGAADAYERLVERLLASPQYGERWARHWLDVVHFGESHGYDKDKPRPHAWPYRDYVIRSLNADKPFVRFAAEQVAGDVLYPGTIDGIEAPGFLSAGPWDFIGHAELPESKIDGKVARHLDRDDFVSNVTGTFLGLTVHCAQCHNHKFDPVTQEDYYALQAVFAAIDRTDKAFDTDPAVAAKRAAIEARKSAAAAATAAANALARTSAGEGFSEVERRLAEAAAEQAAAEKALRDLGPPPRTAYVGAVHTGGGTFTGTGASGGKSRPIHLLPRGDVTRPGKAVGPGAVAAVPGLVGRFNLPASHAEGERRAALARWLTDRANPLTWRVIVNRVWQYHFGRGLVDTPNDFGKMGQPPSHPELLDWLAADFRDHGQSLKRLHRLIVTSAAYRRTSASVPANEAADADNRLLWRQQRRKLEAEAVRDAILAVAGKLDLRMGGPSFQDFVIDKPEHSPHYEYHKHDPDDPKAHRRAVYRFTVRSKPQPFMAALDCADPSLAVEKRNQSVSPQQALALLNGRLALAMAGHFAARVERLADDDAGRVTAAFRLALGREPSPAEAAALAEYAKEHGLANACRVVLNLNEFAFVD